MLPFYPFYWGDYSAKTFGLSMLEHGAYMLLLRYVYVEQLPIHNSMRYEISNAKKKHEKNSVDTILQRFFFRDGDYWKNKKAEDIIKAQNERHKSLSNAGLAGAKSKWGEGKKQGVSTSKNTSKKYGEANGQAIGQPNGNYNQNHIHTIINNSVCESVRVREAEPENEARLTPTLSACADIKNDLKNAGEKGKRADGHTANKRSHSDKGSSLPADWRPSEQCLESASGIGVTPQQLKLSEHRFRDHFLNRKGKSETSADWDASFLAWCAGDAQKRAAATERTGSDSAAGRGTPTNKKRDYFDAILAGSAEVAKRQLARARQEQLDRGLLSAPDFPTIEYDYPGGQGGSGESDSEAIGE